MLSLLLASFALSFLCTALFRRYALTTNLMDVPNHRSSHTIATPRGGGFSFVVVFFIGVICLRGQREITLPLVNALIGGGVLVALLGVLDDHQHLPVKVRLLGHFTASAFVLYCANGIPTLSIAGWMLAPGVVTNALALFYLVWLINLYNFMDGIDGIAGFEAVSVCFGAVIMYWLGGHFFLMKLPLILATSVTGFLYWNFPRARIFMGDAGSGFLGLLLGVFSIQAAWINPNYFWGWLILLGVFIVDATVTLVTRIMQGARLHEAHRTHAYQCAASRLNHPRVTAGVVVLNLSWLLPLAIFTVKGVLPGIFALGVAYTPLILLVALLRRTPKPA